MTSTFKERLKAQLKTKKLKQNDLAKIMNVHPSLVSAWVTGKCLPNLNHTIKLADALNITVDHLLGKS